MNKQLPVDKAYCLHLIENTNRLTISKEQFNKINCLNEIEYVNLCYLPKSLKSNSIIYNALQSVFNLRIDEFNLRSINSLSCILNHYLIIKRAYLEGYEHIAVFEDDVTFIDNQYFLNCINNLPKDYDIINFIIYADMYGEGAIKYNDYFYKINEQSNKSYMGWCTTAIFYSRNGMKYFIDFFDNNLYYADSIFFDLNQLSKNIKLYFTEHMCVVNDEKNSTINLNEHIC